MTVEEKIDKIIDELFKDTESHKTYSAPNDRGYIKRLFGRNIIIPRETMDDWPDNLSEKSNKVRIDRLKKIISDGLEGTEPEIFIPTESINSIF